MKREQNAKNRYSILTEYSEARHQGKRHGRQLFPQFRISCCIKDADEIAGRYFSVIGAVMQTMECVEQSRTSSFALDLYWTFVEAQVFI